MMQALCKQKEGPGHLSLVDLEEPEPGPGQVKIAIEAAGICGTDIHIRYDRFPYSPPVILGHEFSGQISAVGPDVDGLEVGDRVMAETTAVLCGQCPFCQRGQTNNCPRRRVYGVHINGGFAEYIVVRKQAIHPLPPNVDYVSAAMTEPLAVCVHALTERTQVSAGQVVLVTGPGPIGLLAALVAKAHGATVIVAGIAKDRVRLELAKAIGADLTLQADQVDMTDQIRPFCEDQGGVDVMVEASGAPASVAASYKCTRKGGTIVQLGLFDGPITVDYSQIAFREFNVIGSFAHCWSSFDRALDLMAKEVVNVKALVTGIPALDQWEQAFGALERGEGAKILLAPPGSTVGRD